MGEQKAVSHLRFGAGLTRSISRFGIDLAMPNRELHEPHDGITQAEQLLEAGGGLIVVTPHFSRRDFPELLRTLTDRSDAINKRKILIPIAYHQYSHPVMGRVQRGLTWINDIKLAPLVTRNSFNLGKHGGHDMGHGEDKYFQAANQFLHTNEVVMLAPQGRRKITLGEPPPRKPISLLFNETDDDPTLPVGVLHVGLAIKYVTDYAAPEIGSYNWRRTSEITVGPMRTKDELRALAQEQDTSADHIVFQTLSELVSPQYR